MAYILKDTTLFAHSYGIWVMDYLYIYIIFHMMGIFSSSLFLLTENINSKLYMPFFWLVMGAKRSLAHVIQIFIILSLNMRMMFASYNQSIYDM